MNIPITQGHITRPTTLVVADWRPAPVGRFGESRSRIHFELIRAKKGERIATVAKYHAEARLAARDVGVKITLRKQPAGGWGIWRIS